MNRHQPVDRPTTRQHLERGHGDAGEGVISTAIAVLIVAFIGAAMWVAFNGIWTDAEGNIQREVESIGASPAP